MSRLIHSQVHTSPVKDFYILKRSHYHTFLLAALIDERLFPVTRKTVIRSQSRNNHCSYQRHVIWWCSRNLRWKLIYVGQYCDGVIKSEHSSASTGTRTNYWNIPTFTDTISYYTHQKENTLLLEPTESSSLEVFKDRLNHSWHCVSSTWRNIWGTCGWEAITVDKKSKSSTQH